MCQSEIYLTGDDDTPQPPRGGGGEDRKSFYMVKADLSETFF